MKGRIIFLVIFFVTCVTIGYFILKEDRVLPVLAPSDINRELVDISMVKKRSKHKIADFAFTDQNGKTVTNADFPGVYVADFFFTTCPNMCPKMTAQMTRVYEAFEGHPDVKFLSHTVHPEVDSVETLAAFAKAQNINGDQWHLVTGEKPALYDMARKSYCVAKSDGDGGQYDFIHTENFVLIDKQRQIRGFYNGIDAYQVDMLIEDIEVLLSER